MCVYVYIYTNVHKQVCEYVSKNYICIYIYIYTHIERGRERGRGRDLLRPAEIESFLSMNSARAVKYAAALLHPENDPTPGSYSRGVSFKQWHGRKHSCVRTWTLIAGPLMLKQGGYP